MFRTRHVKKYNKYNKYKRFRNKYSLYLLRMERSFKGPVGVLRELGAAVIDRKEIRKEYHKRRIIKKAKTLFSKKINLSLFKVTYDMLLNYHSPLGKKLGEWKPGVMLTNVLLVRNNISILDLTTVFFSLRKMVNRLFKALKLRKGIAVLNGRKYRWRKVFTFVFERWLPGFLTNFYLNIKELISYFFKRKCLTRRQKTRILSLKMLSYDRKFIYNPNLYANKKKGKKKKRIYRIRFKVKKKQVNSVRRIIRKILMARKRKRRIKRKMKKKKNINNLISFLKLPSVSLSLIDNLYWLRECQKEGVTTIQITDVSSDIEKIDYPVISNQKSIAFLSFITLLAKEVAYQARYWELTNFKAMRNYYAINERLKENNKYGSFKSDKEWLKEKLNRYNYRLTLGYTINKRLEKRMDFKLRLRSFLKKWEKKMEKVNK